MEKVLAARRYFREHLPARYAGAIAFFDPTDYNVAITIQENVIFGKIAYGQAQAPQRIAELLTDLLDRLELRAGVMAVGLDSPVGIGGGRLSVAQRQKLGSPAPSASGRTSWSSTIRWGRSTSASRSSCATRCWRRRRAGRSSGRCSTTSGRVPSIRCSSWRRAGWFVRGRQPAAERPSDERAKLLTAE